MAGMFGTESACTENGDHSILAVRSANGAADGALHLVIGNKNYSSWSFRPWLAMKVAGISFDETVISLEAQTSRSG